MLRKISRAALALFLALCMVSSFGFTFGEGNVYAAAKKKKVKVTSITLNHKVYTVKRGKSLKLKTIIKPAKAKKTAKIVWKTSKKKYATVSKKGLVKATKKKYKKAKKVKITATVKGTKKKAVCTVYIGTPVKKVVLAQSTLALKTGETASAGAKVSPAKATVKKIKYTSDNEAVATVNAKGQITAVGAGTAVITAKPVDEAGKKAKLTVTVEDPVVPVTGVKLNATEKTLEQGETFDLAATVEPENATNKTVTYASSDTSVAAVDENGKVTAVKRGKADITVTTADGGKTAVCKIQVNFPAQMAVESAKEVTQEIIDAIKSGEITELLIKNGENLNLTLPKEDLSNANLIVDAPKGHIENFANFKNIVIKAISSSSFVEHAQGNSIDYAAYSGRIEVAEGGEAEVSVVKGARYLTLVNDGSVSALNITTGATVDLSGESGQTVLTNISGDSRNAIVETSLGLNVNAESYANLIIREGAEDTRVSINNDGAMPNIIGLSRIEVINTETGESTFIVGTNDGQEGITTKKVTLAGDVKDVNNNPVSKATVYAVPYTGKYTTAEVANLLSKAVGKATSAADGSYTIADVPAGNYYIFVRRSNYADYCATTIITSSNAETFNVPVVTLLEAAEASKVGTLSGALIDSVTGDPVEPGLTVLLREGGNNISGDAIQTTTTDGDGRYKFAREVKLGQYTVQVLDKRTSAYKHYITTSFDALVSKAGANTVNNTVSYMLDSEQVRFVLTWGDKASGASADIDSHLVGPMASGEGHFHTWYSDLSYWERSGDQVTTYADLDRDDVDYEGPETTTIYMKSKGVYSFYVHDFSNLDKTSGSTQLSKSGAVVKVYMGSTLKKEFSVPNKEGILWHVCDYDTTTNKITERNTMGYWPEDDLESIGLDPSDLCRLYQEKLADRISRAEKYIGEMKDGVELKATGKTLVSDAKANKSSTDLTVLRNYTNDLNEWLSEAESPLAFEVTGDSIYEYNRETETDISLLKIVGFTDTLPAFTVTPDYEDTTCEVKASDKSEYKKMVVVKAATGVTRTYYVTYEKSVYGAEIDEVISKDEEAFPVFRSVYDNESTSSERVLDIYGATETAPANFLDLLDIKALDSKAVIQLSSAAGYDGKAVIKSGNVTKTYLIKYHFDIDDALCLYDIRTDERVDENDEESDNLIGWTDIHEPEEDIDYGTATIYLNSEKKPTTLIFDKGSALAKAEVKTSDRNPDEKMVVVSYKTYSKKYYIEYDYTTWAKFGLKDIEKDNLYITEWWTDDEESGTEDEYVDVLVMTGMSEELPADLKFTTVNSESKATLKDSDLDGYDKMVVVTFRDTSRNYYIRYNYDEDAFENAFLIESVAVKDSEGECIADGYGWSQNDDNSYVFYVDGDVSEITPDMDFAVSLISPKSKYEVLKSDLADYPVIIRVTFGSDSRDYYVSYSYRFDISDVYLYAGGDNVVTGFTTYVDSDGNNVLELQGNGYNGEITEDEYLGLEVYTNGSASPSVESSDIEGYGCKLTLTSECEDGPHSMEYYVTYAYTGE